MKEKPQFRLGRREMDLACKRRLPLVRRIELLERRLTLDADGGMGVPTSSLLTSDPDNLQTASKETAHCDDMVLADDILSRRPPSAPGAPGASTTVSVLALRTDFQDATVSCGESAIHTTLFAETGSVSRYYEEASFGTQLLIGEVRSISIGYFTTSPCEYRDWSSAARNAAIAIGINPSSYDRIIYFFPTSTCSPGGLGEVSGNESWIFDICGNAKVIAHELGHNFGWGHANRPGQEYGDSTSVMGSALFGVHPNAVEKRNAGWIPSDRYKEVSESGQYRIAPSESLAGIDPLVIGIRKADTKEFYYLSYRRPVGMDAAMRPSDTNKISVHRWDQETQYQPTELLQIVDHRGLFADTSNGVYVRLIERNEDYAVIEVSFSSPPADPFARIAFTNFDEAPQGVGTYIPSAGSAELGFTTTSQPTGGANPRVGVFPSIFTPTTPVFAHSSLAATTTFNRVGLDNWGSVVLSLIMKVYDTTYELGDFLHVYVTDGEVQIDLFHEHGTAGFDPLDTLADDGFLSYFANIPNTWTQVTLVIQSSSNSTAGAEIYGFDSIEFVGIIDPLPEDIDANGRVDLNDVALLQISMGLSGTLAVPAADLNRDRRVDRVDAALMAASFGRTANASHLVSASPNAFSAPARPLIRQDAAAKHSKRSLGLIAPGAGDAIERRTLWMGGRRRLQAKTVCPDP